MRRRFAVALLLAGCKGAPPTAVYPRLPGWTGVTTLLDSAIAAHAAPGAVVGVSLAGYHAFYGTGHLGIDDDTRPDSSTIYDLASLTKVIGLTTMVMLAVEEGRLAVDSPVVRYLPLFGADSTQPERRTVTLRHLLTHSSGLPAWRPLYQEAATRRDGFALADSTRLVAPPGAQFTYSDLGAIVLTQAVENTMGHRIDTLLAERVFQPLGMQDTRYLPPDGWRSRIAPTENDPWRGRVLRGEVHDENASRLDGVSGHAGLFSSARDLLRFADWLLANWTVATVATVATDPTGNCTNSMPVLFGRKERIEDLTQILLRDSDARVDYANRDVFARPRFDIHSRIMLVDLDVLRLDPKLPAVRHRVARVDTEVHQHLVKLRSIGEDERQVRRHAGLDRDVLRQRIAGDADHVGDQIAGADIGALAFLAARE